MSSVPSKYKPSVVIKAIKGSGGIVSTVAGRLDCDWNTARKYIDAWPETVQAYEDEKEAILDMAEGTIYKSIKGGDVQSAKWVMSTIGRKRGFTERTELTGADGESLEITYKIVKPDADNDIGK